MIDFEELGAVIIVFFWLLFSSCSCLVLMNCTASGFDEKVRNFSINYVSFKPFGDF